ncbi:MAG: glycosyltransferase N-terminal domain-containing protein [Candidatus Electryonea clarkiae]|nr:glycosyltransferase N-terminal domain-containing protein [Candidatus Electryonea clarkiae]MDP8285202.1 glycosyltransferase N-terminal domain-containing protein [Candidatus Electryonea clarkiae]
MISRVLYNTFGIPLMASALRLGSLGSTKIREGIRDRNNEGKRLRLARQRCSKDRKRIIIHCASAGELESAIPLIDALKEKSNAEIILTYFSPSAVQRSEKIKVTADNICLPFDSARRVKRFLGILDPSLVIIVKHDIWPNLVWMSRDRGIPAVLVNGNFRPDSARLSWYSRGFNRAILGSLDCIFAVADDDAMRFRELTGDDVTIEAAGDTRFDRVRQRALDGREDQGELAELLENHPTAVAGSTWPDDEKLLLSSWSEIQKEISDAVLILVPHEPTEEHLLRLAKECKKLELGFVRLSELKNGSAPESVICVDSTGILAGLYGLGKIAYVGGGHGKGVHSVIEPAVFGIPVLFGPNFLMSHEARDLIRIGAAQAINKNSEIITAFSDALSGKENSKRCGELAARYVDGKTGVSDMLASRLAEFLEK